MGPVDFATEVGLWVHQSRFLPPRRVVLWDTQTQWISPPHPEWSYWYTSPSGFATRMMVLWVLHQTPADFAISLRNGLTGSPNPMRLPHPPERTFQVSRTYTNSLRVVATSLVVFGFSTGFVALAEGVQVHRHILPLDLNST